MSNFFWKQTSAYDGHPTAKGVFTILGGVFALVLVIGSFFTVRSGQRGIVFTFGEITSVRNEGLHVKLPFIQSVEKVSVRTQRKDADATAVSKNLQPVFTTITLNYCLNPLELKKLYSTVGLNVEDKIIAGRVQETVKAIVARYAAEELVSRRKQVKDEIVEDLTAQLRAYEIIVNPGDIQITDFRFSDAFNKAIEDKQIAEQQALKAENDLKRVEIEASQKIAEAKGNAEAIRIQSLAIQGLGGKDYVALKTIEKWDGHLPTYTGGAVPFIDVKK